MHCKSFMCAFLPTQQSEKKEKNQKVEAARNGERGVLLLGGAVHPACKVHGCKAILSGTERICILTLIYTVVMVNAIECTRKVTRF